MADKDVAGDLVKELPERFKAEVARLDKNSSTATHIYVPTIGVLDYVFVESILPKLDKNLGRRAFFAYHTLRESRQTALVQPHLDVTVPHATGLRVTLS